MNIRVGSIARRVIRAAMRRVRGWVIGRVRVSAEPIRHDGPVRIVTMAALPAGAWDQPWPKLDDEDWNPEDYGWTPHGEVIEHLRSCGYVGAGFAELTQNAFNEMAEATYWRAEAACRGELLNAEGMHKRVDPMSLFKGQETRALKYASEELLRFWQDEGRMTVANYRADLLEDAHAYRHTTFA